MSLFSRNTGLPGLVAPARDLRNLNKGLKKLRPGDIAVVDAPDITRAFAQQLVELGPVAVINIAPSSTGSVPNWGPQILLDAGITVVDDTGAELWESFKDGKKLRLTDDGGAYYGERLLACGTVLTPAEVEATREDASSQLIAHMEAFFGNTIQFIYAESQLLIDGFGVPETGQAIRGRKVVVVSPGENHKERVKQLRNFIREFEPVLIGVDSAADSLVSVGYQPDFIVGDPENIGTDALRSGARVILPASPDGHAPGLERIQDLGVGATTFPTTVDTATDLAILFADYHQAELIVNAGSPLDLDVIFRNEELGNPASLLARTKAGGRLVDAEVIVSLYAVRSQGFLGWLWALLGLLVLVAVVLGIAGSMGDGTFVENLIDTWNNIALGVQGLFR